VVEQPANGLRRRSEHTETGQAVQSPRADEVMRDRADPAEVLDQGRHGVNRAASQQILHTRQAVEG
jgi:hypothetical protein